VVYCSRNDLKIQLLSVQILIKYSTAVYKKRETASGPVKWVEVHKKIKSRINVRVNGILFTKYTLDIRLI
jgi:hypothetical protein